jgi:hypothetical protein
MQTKSRDSVMKNGKWMETTEIKFVRSVVNWIRNITIKERLGIFNLGDQNLKYTNLMGKLMFYKWKLDISLDRFEHTDHEEECYTQY